MCSDGTVIFRRTATRWKPALMALEKWLYDEVEADRSIAQWVQYIYDHAESLAFAGVLVAVGMRYPGLFTKELQPLLGNFYVYQCQMSWAVNESQEIVGNCFERDSHSPRSNGPWNGTECPIGARFSGIRCRF